MSKNLVVIKSKENIDDLSILEYKLNSEGIGTVTYNNLGIFNFKSKYYPKFFMISYQDGHGPTFWEEVSATEAEKTLRETYLEISKELKQVEEKAKVAGVNLIGE